MYCPYCDCEVDYLDKEYDARGIYVGSHCGDPKCEKALKAKYRVDIWTDSQYECDEPIEVEDY
jgi:hypothetical protein